MTKTKTITPLLWRVIVFLGFIVILSAAVGPRIISGGILFRDGFALYGGIGKALIFSLITLLLMVRHHKTPLMLRPWQPALLGWFAGTAISFYGVWLGTTHLLADHRSAGNLLLVHGGLVLSMVLAWLGCFGLHNVRLVWHVYRREIARSAAIGTLFYLFLLVVYALWRPLASLVLWCVSGLLSLSGLHGVIIPPNTLLFDKFGITVAQYCSGIESIALFTGLYVVVGLMDWQRLNRKRYVSVFPLALLVLGVLNIVRVYVLILAGYYINPRIAFTLFHTYAGLVFFILYSAVFWALAYRYLVSPKGTDLT